MRRLIAAVLSFAAVVACDSNKISADLSADAGNYVLRSLNDTVLPYTVLNTASLSIVILSDTIFMGLDGRFTDRTHYQRTSSGVTDFPADTTTGSWDEQGATVTFTASTGDTFSANFVGESLVMLGGGLKATYTK
jgi:hypothetical protein